MRRLQPRCKGHKAWRRARCLWCSVWRHPLFSRHQPFVSLVLLLCNLDNFLITTTFSVLRSQAKFCMILLQGEILTNSLYIYIWITFFKKVRDYALYQNIHSGTVLGGKHFLCVWYMFWSSRTKHFRKTIASSRAPWYGVIGHWTPKGTSKLI